MSFFRFFQNNRLLVHYLSIIVVILGFASLFKMQREARPNVDFNRVVISAIYPGASPSDIESLVIDPIEEKIDEVDGIEEYRSVSFSGAGSLSVIIDEDYPNPQEVVDEIRRKIAEIKDLPNEVDDPIVMEIKAINIPVLRVALYGNLSPFEMKLEIEKLKDYLRTFDSVQSVDYTGLEDLQLQIFTYPEKLDQFELTLMEVMDRLNTWAKQRPGGILENATKNHSLTVGLDYNDIEKLKNFVVRSNFEKKSVQLSDVSEIRFDTEDTQKKSIFGNENATLLTIVKKPFADAIDTVDEVKLALSEYAKKFPKGLKYKLYTDESQRVRDRLKIVTQNALFGLILVLVLLVIFLNWRSALVTSMGIPVAILGGIILLYATGNTMNSLVLVGIIIVLGMLVDDAIVVCENIYFHLEQGMNAKEAALKGVQEIATPVIATVLTTVFAFLPILFMKGIMGQFLSVIPMAVVSMLCISLLEALIILPVHAREVMKVHGKKKTQTFLLKIENQYEKYLRWSLKKRYFILLFILITFLSSGILGKKLFERFSLFPAKGLEGLQVRLELPNNSPLDKTNELIKELSQKLDKVSEQTFESLYATAGEVRTGGNSGSLQSASHYGAINVVFTTDPSFTKKEDRIVKNIRELCKKFAEEHNVKTSITLDRPGPPIGKPIQIQITSRDLKASELIIDKLKNELIKIKGVHSLETDLDGNSVQYRFLVNNQLAVSQGVNPSEISQTIFAASTGRIVNEVLINNEKVELLVSVANKHAFQIDDILKLKVRNQNGVAVPLKTFVKLQEEKGPSSIQRFNGLRTITLFGEVDENIITGKEANKAIAPFLVSLKKENPNIRIETGGEEKDRMETLQDTMRLYILALILIFMVISLSFRSILYPLLVLLAIPLGLCGVVWALLAHQQPLSLMGIIGIVGLSGVVVNVSIILLKYVQERIQEGIERDEAIVQAGVRRLRPIVITTITTLVGLIPTIYGIGGVDSFVQPIALVLGWGLFVSTLLSIFALPALVSISLPKENLWKQIRKKMNF